MNTLPTFINHYQTKLPLDNPHFDILLVIVFLGLFFLTLKKNFGDLPLSVVQTNQVKGLAILLIISNHLCYYTKPLPSLYKIWSEAGMVGVAIFFIFSGYGMCVSIQKRGIQDFFRKKIVRIFIPLVYALSLLLGLYIVFTPGMKNRFLLEIPRILFSMESLDGKMWFILFILSWYCLLYIGVRMNLSNGHKLLFLLGFSFIIITGPDMPYVAKGNALSFPFGCWLGLNYSTVIEKIGKFLQCRLKMLVFFLTGLAALAGLSFWLAETLKFHAYQTIIVIAVLLFISASLYLLYSYLLKKTCVLKKASLEFISCTIIFSTLYFNYLSHALNEKPFDETLFLTYWSASRSLANVLIASSLTLVLALMLKYQCFSPILSFLGWISFELFLVHNTFLVHFDFILFRGPIIIMFPIYFLGICLLSLILKRTSEITSSQVEKL